MGMALIHFTGDHVNEWIVRKKEWTRVVHQGVGMAALSSRLKYDCDADIKHVTGPARTFTAH